MIFRHRFYVAHDKKVLPLPHYGSFAAAEGWAKNHPGWYVVPGWQIICHPDMWRLHE